MAIRGGFSIKDGAKQGWQKIRRTVLAETALARSRREKIGKELQPEEETIGRRERKKERETERGGRERKWKREG